VQEILSRSCFFQPSRQSHSTVLSVFSREKVNFLSWLSHFTARETEAQQEKMTLFVAEG
jgi:hypothetical protein